MSKQPAILESPYAWEVTSISHNRAGQSTAIFCFHKWLMIAFWKVQMPLDNSFEATQNACFILLE